jgi:two-component system cell cycle response regulator
MVTTFDILTARILIVDDMEDNLRMLEAVLREAGYTSVSATQDPRGVKELHRRNDYDLIILDLQMPMMDGFEVMESLKEFERDGYLPVLAVTAEAGHKLRALQYGAKDFIRKPYDIDEIRLRVRNMLEVRLLYRQLNESNREMSGRMWVESA